MNILLRWQWPGCPGAVKAPRGSQKGGEKNSTTNIKGLKESGEKVVSGQPVGLEVAKDANYKLL